MGKRELIKKRNHLPSSPARDGRVKNESSETLAWDPFLGQSLLVGIIIVLSSSLDPHSSTVIPSFSWERPTPCDRGLCVAPCQSAKACPILTGPIIFGLTPLDPAPSVCQRNAFKLAFRVPGSNAALFLFTYLRRTMPLTRLDCLVPTGTRLLTWTA